MVGVTADAAGVTRRLHEALRRGEPDLAEAGRLVRQWVFLRRLGRTEAGEDGYLEGLVAAVPQLQRLREEAEHDLALGRRGLRDFGVEAGCVAPPPEGGY